MRTILAMAMCCLALGGCVDAGRYAGAKPARRAEVHAAVTAAARAEGVPLNIAHAVARTESDYADAVNKRSGAAGPMQVLPRTAAEVGESVATFGGRLRAGMKYLRRVLALPGATLCEKLSAYNRGLHAPRRCTAYGRAVAARAAQ
jgi:soluble lytic murein transglycosylase-like protein